MAECIQKELLNAVTQPRKTTVEEKPGPKSFPRIILLTSVKGLISYPFISLQLVTLHLGRVKNNGTLDFSEDPGFLHIAVVQRQAKKAWSLIPPFLKAHPMKEEYDVLLFPAGNMMGLDLGGLSLFHKLWKDMQVQCSTGTLHMYCGRLNGRKECLHLQWQWLVR